MHTNLAVNTLSSLQLDIHRIMLNSLALMKCVLFCKCVALSWLTGHKNIIFFPLLLFSRAPWLTGHKKIKKSFTPLAFTRTMVDWAEKPNNFASSSCFYTHTCMHSKCVASSGPLPISGNTDSRKEFLRLFPDQPSSSDTLEAQQAALLRQQERNLQALRQQSRS